MAGFNRHPPQDVCLYLYLYACRLLVASNVVKRAAADTSNKCWQPWEDLGLQDDALSGCCLGPVESSSVTWMRPVISVGVSFGLDGWGNTCRSVVNKCDFHHGLEDSILDSVCFIAVLDLFIEVLVQPLGLVTPEGTMEVGFASLLGRGQ